VRRAWQAPQGVFNAAEVSRRTRSGSPPLLIQWTLSRTLKPKEQAMNIEIRNAALAARIQKQIQATGSGTMTFCNQRLQNGISYI